jgi:hypothetical protein
MGRLGRRAWIESSLRAVRPRGEFLPALDGRFVLGDPGADALEQLVERARFLVGLHDRDDRDVELGAV